FADLWLSPAAREVRQLVSTCPKNCWMVGTAAPVMKKYIRHPLQWVAKNKIKSLLGKPVCIKDIPHYDVGQDPLQGDLREPANPVNDNREDIKYILRESEVEEWLADPA
ncbi:MAG: hypothetical protein KDI14_19365, partial [Halioglobus sp.]|nr:hypothetical protein [Halioglobus sp.]